MAGSRPKSHHYVPRFYLGRFADSRGKLWVLDKPTWHIYSTALKNIACVNHFYVVPELQSIGVDPCLLERQFSAVEGEACNITECWFRQFDRGDRIQIPDVNREIVSLFLTLQMLRTIEARTQLTQLIAFATAGDSSAPPFPATSTEESSLHASVLWDDTLVQRAARRLHDCVWIFGKNESPSRFCTSDHPVLIKSGDNRGWVSNTLAKELLHEHPCDPEDYIVFPLSPGWILYCYDRQHYPKMTRFDTHVSPVAFTPDMVNHENSGQIGMSHRFVYSFDGDFSFAQQFADEQPWIRDPQRDRFEQHPNPYESDDGEGVES